MVDSDFGEWHEMKTSKKSGTAKIGFIKSRCFGRYVFFALLFFFNSPILRLTLYKALIIWDLI